MKNSLKVFILLFVFNCCFNSNSFSQTIDLTNAQINDINDQIKETIDAFLNYLSYQSSHSFDINKENDKKRLNRISNYFIKSARIGISNKWTGDTTSYDYYKYLTIILPGYHDKYKLVEIKAIPLDNEKIKQLKPVYKNKVLIGYDGNIRYKQTFKGLGSFMLTSSKEIGVKSNFKFVPDYSDKVIKEAEIQIRIIETSGGQDWIIKIGDIKVIDTKPYSKL